MQENTFDPIITPDTNQATPNESASIPKPVSILDNDLLMVKKAQPGVPTYTPTRFVEQFYLQDNGVLWININNVWRANHWEFISSATGDNVTVPAGTSFIIVSSNSSNGSDNESDTAEVILSKDKLTGTYSARDQWSNSRRQYTAVWDLNAGTITTGRNGTFYFYT